MKNLITKVLLIDDDDFFYNILKSRFAKQGLFLIWAKDGEEGLEKARIEMPALIITDIVMPRLNGFEIIRRIKSQPMTTHIDFVILSSWGEPRLVYDENFLNALGVKKYLIKSIHTPTDILKEVKAILA